MNALEANTLTKESLRNLHRKILSDIISDIRKESEIGRFHLQYNIDKTLIDESFFNQLISFFENQGYTITGRRDEYIHTNKIWITWSSPKESKM